MSRVIPRALDPLPLEAITIPSRLARAQLLVALLAGCASAQDRPHVAPRASVRPAPASGADRPLVRLPGLPARAVLRAPSVAVDGRTVFVAGNLFRDNSVVGPSAYLGRLRRTAAGALVPVERLPLPPGNFQFAFPRIVAGGGRLHLVWAELTSRWRTDFEWETPANFSTSLWHAVLERGAWSAPARISTASSFGWNTRTGGVALEESGTLHVAAWRLVDGDSARVFDFRWSDGRWEGASLPYQPGLSQTTAIAARGDTVTVALGELLDDTTRVLVGTSRDHGATWTAPLVATRRPRGSSMMTRLSLAVAGDELLLAVGEQPNGRVPLDTLRVFGLTRSLQVTSQRVVNLPPTVAGFDLVAGPCGIGLLLLNTFSTEPRLFTASLPRDAATPAVVRRLPWPKALFSTMAADRGSALAVFGYMPPAALFRNVAVTLPVCRG